MQIIKIPFSIKFYFFFALMGIFLSLLGMDYGYGYYGLNYLLTGIISLLLSIIQVFLIFKYFNNPIKYSNLNIYFIIFMLLLYIGLTMYKSFFLIIIILYHLIFLFKFIQFKKFLNLEEGDKKNKYIKYTNKNQYKNVLISYGIVVLLFIIFYFVQYSKVINFKHIDDSYFNTPKQYLDISEDENGYKNLKLYGEYRKNIEFIEDKNFRNEEYMNKVISDTGITFKFDIDRVKEIDNLRLGIDKIINKKAIIYNFDENYPSLEGLSMMTRESLYNALYHLEKGEEEKGINYLIENYKLSKLLISSYGTLVNFIVGITINNITLSDLEFIMNNYELKDSTLNYIKNNFENSIDINSSFEISMNYEYNYILSELLTKTPETVNINGTLIFFSKNYLKEGLKNVYYGTSQMYNDMELDLGGYYNTNKINTNSFDSSDEYICSKKNIDTLRGDGIPKLFFRKNTVSNILLVINCISNPSYKPDLENTIIKEKNILDKINKMLDKNKSKDWKAVLKNK